MNLVLAITDDGRDKQVKCYLGGRLLPDFFSYGKDWPVADIESDVGQRMHDKNYDFERTEVS